MKHGMVWSRVRPLMVSALSFGVLFFVPGCQNKATTANAYGSWSFSGFVVDGSTDRPLANVVVSYFDQDGVMQEISTDTAGAFFIQSLPYGSRSFKFSYVPPDTGKPEFTQRIVTASSYNESNTMPGVIGDVSRVVSLYPLTGRIAGTFYAKMVGSSKTVAASEIRLGITFNDSSFANSTPLAFAAMTDSLGAFEFTGLPVAPGASMTVLNFILNGISYSTDAIAVPQLFSSKNVSLGTLFLAAKDSTQMAISSVRSNVLSSDGFGLSGVPVDVKLWYVLPVPAVASSVSASVSGGGNPSCLVRTADDTVYISPATSFKNDSLITVTISGRDSLGNRIEFVFDGAKRFTTESGLFPVASNMWPTPLSVRKSFALNDTLWVKFSHALDGDVNKIEWSKSSADNTIYGTGANVNADVWVRSDTLFVRPDQRLSINFSQTMGFKISLVSAEGKKCDSLDMVAKTVDNPYFVRWTNTKDFLGNMRTGLGTMDSIVVVSNAAIDGIKGLSGISGKAVPAGLTLDNVKLKGDTIIYKPSLFLKADTTYGLSFDILFKDGNLRTGVLGVTWKTAYKILILSVDNRANGQFRPLRVIGDSITVSFSEPVDTASNATVPFKVNMTDVKNSPVMTTVKWKNNASTAVIFNIDTLPAADVNASPAYTSDAVNTKAVKSLSFDLVTKNHEPVFGFTPKNDSIEIHTEQGLACVDANILAGHSAPNDVGRAEDPVDNFPLSGSVRLTFNRSLDTTAMRKAGTALFAGLKAGADTVSAAVSFSPDARTLVLTPAAQLKANTDYYVWFKNVPGMNIAGAKAINKNAGTISGTSASSAVLDRPFNAK